MIVDADDIVLMIKVILILGAGSVLYHMALGIIRLIQDWRRDDKD